MKVLEVVTDGFEDMEAIGTLSLLKRAGVDLTFAAIGSHKATGRYGVVSEEMPDVWNLDLDEYGMLIIPGGPEYMAEEKNPRFLALVFDFAKKGKYIAAICAGPTILGHLGLLKGKKYTCFTSMDEDFGGTYVDTYAVKDGRIITGRSVAAVNQFSLEIIRAVKGEDAVNRIREEVYF
ncbi:MAG: DJ-1/PfpI family protein [Bacilli bacterium]|jgi:putative intracellular protease/amidase|nr:DJ-1/PfpI family protein [Bacilli bacterium]